MRDILIGVAVGFVIHRLIKDLTRQGGCGCQGGGVRVLPFPVTSSPAPVAVGACPQRAMPIGDYSQGAGPWSPTVFY